MHWQRQFLHPMLRAMDAPTREECTARRPRSNTPLAALTLLNDPTFVEAAVTFAARLLSAQELQTDPQRVQYAMLLATSRYPDEFELQQLLALLSAERKYYQSDTAAAAMFLGNSPRVEQFDRAELAALAQVTRAILNLHEVMTRN